MKILFIIAMIAVGAVATSAQTQCSTVEECNGLVTTLTQALNKTLDANKAQTGVTDAQKAQIEAQKGQIQAQERLIAVKDAINAEQSKLIDFYQKQTCSTTSFLWGLIKSKKCSVR